MTMPPLRSSLRLAPLLAVAVAGIVTAAGGCRLLTGVDDLQTEAAPASSSPAAGGDAGTRDSGTSSVGDGGSLDGSVDGATSTRLREITFEDGSLKGLHGGDTVVGTPVVTTTGALRGTTSMSVTGGSSYIEASITPSSDVYLSFVLNITAMPPDNVYATIARLSFAGSTTTLDIAVASGSGLRFTAAGSSISYNTVAVGVTYRVGVHLRPGGNGGTSLEPFLVEGATSTFGAGGSRIGIGSLGALERVAFGAVGAEPLVGLFDHALLDSAMMPGP
jgi:hypothetical protein